MAAREFSFTSESVTEGHPDKIADQVSDAVLDAVLAGDPAGRVACETLITTGLVVVAGEITTETYVDIPQLVRKTIAEHRLHARQVRLRRRDVRRHGRDRRAVAGHRPGRRRLVRGPARRRPTRSTSVGAGDQGMMFGYASNETDELMPLPIQLAHKITKRLSEVRKADVLPYLRPDGKAQVTIRYEVSEDGRQRPVEIERILVSTQHRDGLDSEALIKPDLIEHVLHPILPHDLYDEKRLEQKDFVYVNPTGKFVIGGPMGDTGLTGRKIIVDTYGGAAPHGGGAFSGKDPTKVDRSAAYAARYVAKNVVAAGPRRPLPDPGRVRDRRRAPALRARRHLRHRGRGADAGRRSSSSSTSTSTCARRRSCATSTCAARSTRRRPRTATSAATTATSRGSGRTRPTRFARPPVLPQQQPPRRPDRLPTGPVALGLVLLFTILVVGWVKDIVPDFANPFSEETVDRTSPAVLKSIENLRDFRAATGHFEVIVDVEQDQRFVPAKIKGERVLFVAIGSVDAGVDFTGLEDGAVEVSDDGKSVTLELPPATFREPELDLERSYVYDRDRGAIDRIQSLFGDDDGVEQELYPLAEEKLADAARTGSGLLARAERNTRLMLEGLLRSLGFTSVEVRFSEV